MLLEDVMKMWGAVTTPIILKYLGDFEWNLKFGSTEQTFYTRLNTCFSEELCFSAFHKREFLLCFEWDFSFIGKKVLDLEYGLRAWFELVFWHASGVPQKLRYPEGIEPPESVKNCSRRNPYLDSNFTSRELQFDSYNIVASQLDFLKEENIAEVICFQIGWKEFRCQCGSTFQERRFERPTFHVSDCSDCRFGDPNDCVVRFKEGCYGRIIARSQDPCEWGYNSGAVWRSKKLEDLFSIDVSVAQIR